MSGQGPAQSVHCSVAILDRRLSMSVIIKIAFLHLVILGVASAFVSLYPRYNERNHSGADTSKKYQFHGQCDCEGFEVSSP